MSNVVDQRIVEMRFDNAQFEKGVEQSIKSIDNLKSALNFNNSVPTSSLDSLTSNLTSLGTSVDTIASRFSTMGIAATTWIAKISNSIGDLVGGAIQNLTKNAQAGYNRYNEMMESIQTIMYATRDQWDDTDAQMDYVTAKIDKLNWYTDETSYNLSDMTNSIGKFVAAGISLDDAATAMEGIASWAAISGQNAQKASVAMYNLSQAMGMGKVTTMDWKSIENANMATKEFKQTAIDAAVEAGMLERTYVEEWGDTAVYFTGKLKEGQDITDGILVTAENFRTTLQYNWFDKNVLTKVLKKYGDFADELYAAVTDIGVSTTEFLGYLNEYEEAAKNGADMKKWVEVTASREGINDVVAFGEALEKLSDSYYELGRESFKAAQESKTFKDSMDYTADAITTTWMNIFQDIFGNYLESKELWTAVSELMYEQLVAPLEELEEQFASWNRMGGADYLKDSFWNFYETFNNILKAIKAGWEEIFPNNLGRQLLYYVQDLYDLSQKIRFVDWPWYSDFENLKEAARSIARVFNNLLISLKIIGNSIGDAWNRIFPAKEKNPAADSLTERIRDIAKSLEDLSVKLRLTEEDGQKLERAFAGLFAILDIGLMLISAILEPLTGIHYEMGEVNKGFLDIAASIGDWLVALRDFIKEHSVFKQVIAWLIQKVAQLPQLLDSLSRKIFKIGLIELFGKIAEVASTAFLILAGLFVDFKGTITKVDEYLSQSFFGEFWTKLKFWVSNAWTLLKGFFSYVIGQKDLAKQNIIKFFTNIWTYMSSFFTVVKNKALDVWNAVSGFTSGTWSKIVDFFGYVGSKINDLWGGSADKTKSMGSNISDFFTGIGDKLGRLWLNTTDKAKNAWETIGTFFSGIGEKIKEKWSDSKIGDWFISLGTKIKDFCKELPGKTKALWTKLKSFFGLVGTKAGDIWDSIPENIEKAWNKITGFVDSVKTKASEIWSNIQPYVSVIADGFKKAGDKISQNWDTIWENLVRFFTFVGDKAGKAIEWLISIDWAKWWEDTKKWVDETWTSIKTFFEELPGKANKAFEDLTGTDFETFLADLSKAWEDLQKKVQDVWDTVQKFAADIPNKLDSLAGFFGFASWADLWDALGDKVLKAYHAFKIFFGLEKPKMFDDRGIELNNLEDPPYLKWLKSLIPSLQDLKDSLDKFDSSGFVKHMRAFAWTFMILAFVAFMAFTTMQAIKATKGAVNAISNLIQPSGPFGQIASAMEDIGTGVSQAGKGLFFKFVGDMLLEIAAALAILTTTIAIRPREAALAFATLGLFLIGVTAILDRLSKIETLTPQKASAIGEAFALIGAMFIEISLSIALLSLLDFNESLKNSGLLLGFLAVFISIIVFIDKMKISTKNMIALAEAFVVLGIFLIEVSIALYGLQDSDPNTLLSAAGSLALLLVALTVAIILITKLCSKFGSFDERGLLIIASTFAILGLVVIELSVSLMLLKDMGFWTLIGAAVALTALLVTITACMIPILILSNFSDKINKEGLINIGAIFGILAVVILSLAFAMSLLKDMDPQQIMVAALALAGFIAVMTILMVIVSNFVAINTGLLVFGGALALIGAGAALAGAGMWLLAQAIVAISNANFSNLVDGFVRFTDNLPRMANSAMDAGRVIATNLGPIIVDFFRNLANALTEARPELTEGLTSFFMIFLDALINVWPHIQTFLVMAGETAFVLLGQAVTRLLDVLIAAGPQLETLIRFLLDLGLGVLWDYIPVVSALAWYTVMDALQLLLDNVEDFVRITTEIAIRTITGFLYGIAYELPNIINAGIVLVLAFINGVAQGIEDHAEELGVACRRLIRALIVGFCEFLGIDPTNILAGAKVFANFGQSILQGLIDGIGQMLGNVEQAITGVADMVVNTFGGIIDSHSPSKVFEEYGKNIDEGLANGINDNSDLVEKATTGIGELTTEGFDSSFTDLSSLFDMSLEDENPTITPVLDLTSFNSDMGDLNSMLGDTESFDIAGGIGGIFNMNSQDSFDMEARFGELMDVLTAIRDDTEPDIVQTNTFNITGPDPETIANEVSDILQRQVERRSAVWE